MGNTIVPDPAFTLALAGARAAREALIESVMLVVTQNQERIMADARGRMARKLNGKPPNADFAHQLNDVVHVVLEDHVYGQSGYTQIEDVIGTDGIHEVMRRVTFFIQTQGILDA